MIDFKNYVLGRGRLYFARFKPGTQIPDGFLYFGNTPGFTLTADVDNLDHYSSDYGVKEKDDGVTLQVNRTATITCDNINLPNLALFFFGDTQSIASVAAVAKTYDVTGIKQQFSYILGATLTNPNGDRAIAATAIVGSKDGGTTYDLLENVDFTVNRETGLVEMLITANYDDEDDIRFKYDTAASTWDRVNSGTQQIEGAVRYHADNPKGANRDVTMGYVTITPNGDIDMKGDDWQTIPFTVEINRPKNGQPSVIVDGRPAFA